MNPWSQQDSTYLREVIHSKIGVERFKACMQTFCPAVLSADILRESSADGVARLAAMRAGWDAYESSLFALSESTKSPSPSSSYLAM